MVTTSPDSIAPFAGATLSLVSAAPEETINGASALTVVMTLVVLFAGTESVLAATTANRLAAPPALKGVATMVAVALAFAASDPKSQVMTPPEKLHAPCEFVAETKFIEAARRLVTRTESAWFGPRLVTVMWNVTLLDTNTVEGVALALMARSATGLFAVTTVVTELLPGSGSVTSPVTLATLLFDPALVGVTVMVTVALLPLLMLPRFAVTKPALFVAVP